jgi:hypothetical protein
MARFRVLAMTYARRLTTVRGSPFACQSLTTCDTTFSADTLRKACSYGRSGSSGM